MPCADLAMVLPAKLLCAGCCLFAVLNLPIAAFIGYVSSGDEDEDDDERYVEVYPSCSGDLGFCDLAWVCLYLCLAVNALHSKHYAHCDVKLANCLFQAYEVLVSVQNAGSIGGGSSGGGNGSNNGGPSCSSGGSGGGNKAISGGSNGGGGSSGSVQQGQGVPHTCTSTSMLSLRGRRLMLPLLADFGSADSANKDVVYRGTKGRKNTPTAVDSPGLGDCLLSVLTGCCLNAQHQHSMPIEHVNSDGSTSITNMDLSELLQDAAIMLDNTAKELQPPATDAAYITWTALTSLAQSLLCSTTNAAAGQPAGDVLENSLPELEACLLAMASGSDPLPQLMADLYRHVAAGKGFTGEAAAECAGMNFEVVKRTHGGFDNTASCLTCCLCHFLCMQSPLAVVAMWCSCGGCRCPTRKKKLSTQQVNCQ